MKNPKPLTSFESVPVPLQGPIGGNSEFRTGSVRTTCIKPTLTTLTVFHHFIIR